MSVLVQEQLRAVGVRLQLQQYEFPVWSDRRTAGDFDIDFAALSQDPSPAGLSQSWSCTGGNNVGRYCNPRVDSLLEQATRGQGDPAQRWQAILRQIEADAPAVFLYTPFYVYAVNRRYRNVTLNPVSSWLQLREWTVAPGPSAAVR
jgi:peptide/nickel transport system substrate-binding protein